MRVATRGPGSSLLPPLGDQLERGPLVQSATQIMTAASATKRMSRMIRCMATSTGCCGPWWYAIKKTRANYQRSALARIERSATPRRSRAWRERTSRPIRSSGQPLSRNPSKRDGGHRWPLSILASLIVAKRRPRGTPLYLQARGFCLFYSPRPRRKGAPLATCTWSIEASPTRSK